MKKSLVAFTLLASVGLFLYVTSGAHAQAQHRATPPPGSVGVVDLARVLNEHQQFQTLRDQMRSRVEDKESQLQGMMNEATQLREVQKKLDPNSGDFRENESKLTQLLAKIETFRQQTRRDLINEEAKLYHSVYGQVRDVVAWVAKKRGLMLVLRISDDSINVSNPEEVIKAVNRRVIYHDDTLDITEDVLQAINRNAAKPKTAQQTAPRDTRRK